MRQKRGRTGYHDSDSRSSRSSISSEQEKDDDEELEDYQEDTTTKNGIVPSVDESGDSSSAHQKMIG